MLLRPFQKEERHPYSERRTFTRVAEKNEIAVAHYVQEELANVRSLYRYCCSCIYVVGWCCPSFEAGEHLVYIKNKSNYVRGIHGKI